MKDLGELRLPDNCRYSDDHEWAKPDGGKLRIGISDYAQDHLGDIVFVEFPAPGDKLTAGQSFGVVESVKSVSDLLSPVSGTVVAINEELNDSPELVNSDPYGEGWMILVDAEDFADYESLMDISAYLDFLREA